MARLLPNRVPKTIAPEVQENITTAAHAFDEALGEPTPITDAEVRKLLRVAGTRKRIMDEILVIMEQHPHLVKPPLKLTEILKDKEMCELGEKMETMLTGLLFNVRRERSVASCEYYNAGLIFEEDIKSEVNRNNAEARIVKAKLDAIDRKKSSGRPPATTPPAA